MLVALAIYLALLTIVGIRDSHRIKTFDDFAVAGKRQTFLPVFLSLMATMLGASATLGIADRVSDIGFAAFWWLGTGSIGLALQAFLLSRKIRLLNACTLPDAALMTVGPAAKTLTALIISISWIGVIAAQFVSITLIAQLILPAVNRNAILLAIATFTTLYTAFGGQLSVIKTDALQAIIVFAGLLLTFFWLFCSTPETSMDTLRNVQLLGDSFTSYDLIYLLFITGGAFFLGPDIVSRNLASDSVRTAKRAALAASFALAFCGAIITLVALWGIINIPQDQLGDANPLLYIMTNRLPYPLTVILGLGLVSALLSSTDTCLVNAASIFEHDVLNRSSVRETRIIVALLGACAFTIALYHSGIIDLLLGAYSIYVPGIVCPLALALWFNGKRTPCKPLWYAAVAAGSSAGLLHTVAGIGPNWLALAGMATSLVLGIASFSWHQEERTGNDRQFCQAKQPAQANAFGTPLERHSHEH